MKLVCYACRYLFKYIIIGDTGVFMHDKGCLCPVS